MASELFGKLEKAAWAAEKEHIAACQQVWHALQPPDVFVCVRWVELLQDMQADFDAKLDAVAKSHDMRVRDVCQHCGGMQCGDLQITVLGVSDADAVMLKQLLSKIFGGKSDV